MKHTPTPWVVIYHSHEDVFEVKVVEDKMVADGLAEDADNKTVGNVETLSLPASKMFAACNAYERLKKERDALLRAVRHIKKEACEVDPGDLVGRGIVVSVEDLDVVDKAIALCEGGAE